MATKTDKNAIFIPVCEGSMDIPGKLDIPLTLTRSQGNTEIHTHMSSALPKETADFFRKQFHLDKSVKAVLIFCWAPMWNRLASRKNGLFIDVLKCLKG